MGAFKLKPSSSVTQPFYFTIVSPGNGQILATSETYTSKDAAIGGMQAVWNAMQGKAEYDDLTE